MSEAISNGYSEGSGKKFPYISFFGGLSDQNSNSWVEVAVIRNLDGTFSVYNNGNSRTIKKQEISVDSGTRSLIRVHQELIQEM